jgi:hypothetical protein
LATIAGVFAGDDNPYSVTRLGHLGYFLLNQFSPKEAVSTHGLLLKVSKVVQFGCFGLLN